MPRGAGIEPVSSALGSEFLTTRPPGMSFNMIFNAHPGDSDGKASAYNAGDLGSPPGSGRSPGEGNGNPLQYSCLEYPMEPGRLQSMGSQRVRHD